MKRGYGEEHDLSELLQFLEDGDAGPSNDGDNYREPELEPEHKIFLSHSGVQKNFTEQLCVDLERWGYHPFFDKRPDSLPKGKKFPELIFQAARQCHVAVLILSEDFFTRTKWPMLELEAFAQSQKKNPRKVSILPVYLELSRDGCTKNETSRSRWLSVWREWAETDDRIDVGKWEGALKILGPSNGIEYVQSLGEVALREQIVSAVRRLVPPENTWSDAHVQGRTRICKAIIEKFAGIKPSPLYGVRVLGIHGMGGVGKTTFCKVLCDELYMKFQGKVCHAELGITCSIELQKQVLRDLTDTNPDSLTFHTEEMTTNLLRRRIRQQQVFLALDNVWQQSIEEAKVYLRAGFHHHSIVIITARSIDLLGRLNIDRSDCMEMPELEEEDARWLFLQHAAPNLEFISRDDEQKIQFCINQCKFRKGENISKHFHPLALKVLGAQLGSLGCDPSIWVENLSKEDKFNQFREKDHPIFSVLRKGYDSLLEEDQLLFMDGIFFRPSRRIFAERYNFNHLPFAGRCNDLQVFVMQGIHRIFRTDVFEWLSIVHQTEVRIIKDRLQGLKAKSLLEDIGDDFRGVSVHDLYLEFAILEVKRGALDTRRWVWYDREVAYPTDLARMPSSNCWPNVERVSVKYPYNDALIDRSVQWTGTIDRSFQRMGTIPVDGVKWQHFSNVVVLQLFIARHEVLDLRGLRCLRSLEVEWDRGHGRGYNGGKLVGLGELRNLGWLDLSNIHYAPCFEEIGCLKALEVLRLGMQCDNDCERRPLSPPNLDECIHLRELVLDGTNVCMKSFPDLGKLRSLRKILFQGWTSAREVVGLSSQMCALQELLLIDCHSLRHCPGLGELVSLQELVVGGCDLPSLHKLTNLRRLVLSPKNRVLGFNGSMQLQELRLYGIAELPDFHLLRHLQRLFFSYVDGPMLPQFGCFTALEELIFSHIPEMRILPDMHKLSRLRRFTIDWAPKLMLQLPVLGELVALQYLSLNNCSTSIGTAELPDLHNLTNLQVLEFCYCPIRSLPALNRLTQLRDLRCSYTLLGELPDLSGSKNLERIDLSGCEHLTSLGNLPTMPALEYFNVTTCYRLERLPDIFRSSKNLQYISLCHSGVRLSSEDIMVLATSSISDVFAWDHFPLRYSAMSKEMPLTEAVTRIEAKQSEFFATPQTMVWHFTHACMHDMVVSAVGSISDNRD